MKRPARLAVCAFALAVLCLGRTAAAGDAEGCKDHPLFTRMPGYSIQRCEEQQFDTHNFADSKGATLAVEGHVFTIRYALDTGATEPSRLQIQRNYANAVKKLGGSVLYTDDDGNEYLKVAKDGKEFYAHVSAYITSEWMLTIVEKEGMKQDIVANAEALGGDLRTTGHAAVYGIYFDTGKSVLKPESEAAIAEIAKLLKAQPDLKVYVVGHTDNVGGMDANMKLSQARATAVAQDLAAKHGIAAARLKGYGVGSLAPVGSNDTEEGRAKNRRVELVKQ